MNFLVGWPKPIASSDARVLEGKWMVWGQNLDPNVDQDTIRNLSSMTFYWCHKNMVVHL
jgi:hypothetical protein